MTVLDTLNFVAFNPLQNNNPIAVRRRKLMAKLDEQIQLATNKDYTPTQHKWVTDDEGSQRKVEVAKRVKLYTFFCSFVHLFFSVKRLPNCACCSISTSNSPSSAASRTLRSVSATSASLASSMAFLPLANSSGLLP